MDDQVNHDLIINYLRQFGTNPLDYVLEKFNNYDIVLLGENHAIKENLLFVHYLIPKLYDAGVYSIGMEFGASEDQATLDELVTSQHYNEELARELMFNYNTIFPYKEYWDLYKVVWQLNQSLPKDAKKFRVLNLSYRYNWQGYTGFRTPITYGKVFHKGGTEKYRANIIKQEILVKNEKILILTGSIHAFTKYKVPTFDYLADGFIRLQDSHFGNLLYQLAPDKVFSIALHFMFYNIDGSNTLPANGQLEDIMNLLGNDPIGFDLFETPPGVLRDHSAFSLGYTDFKLQDLIDGYIFLKPIKNLKGCTVDYEFLSNHSLEDVLENFPDPEWHTPPTTLEDYWKLVEEYVNLKKRHFISID